MRLENLLIYLSLIWVRILLVCNGPENRFLHLVHSFFHLCIKVLSDKVHFSFKIICRLVNFLIQQVNLSLCMLVLRCKRFLHEKLDGLNKTNPFFSVFLILLGLDRNDKLIVLNQLLFLAIKCSLHS